MPALGTLTVTTYRQDSDAIDYALAGNTVSTRDLISLRRTLPAAKPGSVDPGVMRTNIKFERTVAVGTTSKPMTFNISAVVPVGVDPAVIQSYIDDVVEPVAISAQFAALAKTGDIHLGD